MSQYLPVSNKLASLRWSFTWEDIDMTGILSDTESRVEAPVWLRSTRNGGDATWSMGR